MNNKPVVSIVMPAYNSAGTIKKSVESVLGQTYSNIELVIVNDGSKDDTETIVKELMKNDSRIKFISVPNGGVSKARNTGIDNATGDYIGFIDSDDTIDNDMYEILMNLIEKYDVKIAHCSYKNVAENGEIISEVGDGTKEYVHTHDEAMECLLAGNLFAGGLWNKLFSRELFDSVRLDESIRILEDVLANFYLFDQVEKSVYINKPCYDYVAVSTSATHSAHGLSFNKDAIVATKKMWDECKGRKYENTARNRYAYNCLNLYRAYIFEKLNKSEDGRKLWQIISDMKNQGCYSGRKDKITLFLYRYSPMIYRTLYTLYDKVRVKKLDPTQ